ncbi:MAG: aromatic ring-hydroxylating dioxygenase subunit alpha [Saprospiraceae bacterium]|nr:aromatic ring-hydroxylating dioxygenase subunit alpha [Saprospiraceae bacterium]
MRPLSIDPDIRKASTLPADFYTDPVYYERTKEAIFSTFWHYVGDEQDIAAAGNTWPFTLLPDCMDEPLLITRNKQGHWFAMSNVCTHRGNILVEKPGHVRMLTCRYHGRCFSLEGKFKSMPAFKEAVDFPRPEDDLPQISLAQWLGLHFVSLNPAVPWSTIVSPIEDRVSFLALDTLQFIPEESKTFSVKANWALYCDNYLEGLHIPFVHPALNAAIDFNAYEYHQFPYTNLQVGEADEGQPAFELPDGHPDFGRSIYAYYFWVFPNLMFNFYPWGLSLNLVLPKGVDQCQIIFRTYRFADASIDRSVHAIDETELEDEAVVELVQRGIRSRLYHQGRFSPTMEPNVHHFHSLLAHFINQSVG